ncbi:hypothetical protein [Bacillus manliponensis]|uniref:RNA helicase n=1 Tax=Bacillus manliponensis TaxID=574376 RepID=A0A073K162_9BACI|nr:hypothetical protein [Bacillus manliponensis]KEK21034.1 hypothetical protein BAMA_09585 [Bacillus manliponensis]
MNLTYYLQHGIHDYEPFYTYKSKDIDPNEIYARQLCEYFVVNKMQYELLSNEMFENEERLIVKHLGKATILQDEVFYENNSVCMEIREYKSQTSMPLLHTMRISHHEIIRYLLKDYIHIPAIGVRKRDCAEIDEDRSCYVLYVTTDKIEG